MKNLNVKYCVFLFLIFVLLFTSCANPRPWTKKEKITAGFFLLAHSADAFTAYQLIETGNYHEINPILGKHPSGTELGAYCSLTALTTLSLCHFYPELRKPLLSGYGIINSILAIHSIKLIIKNR